jgi:hypothetical protein
MMLGLIIPAIFALGYMGLTFSPSSYPRLDAIMRVYRMVGTAVLLVWLWFVKELLPFDIHRGFNMYIWEKLNINYKFIFQFDPRSQTGWQYILAVIISYIT